MFTMPKVTIWNGCILESARTPTTLILYCNLHQEDIPSKLACIFEPLYLKRCNKVLKTSNLVDKVVKAFHCWHCVGSFQRRYQIYLNPVETFPKLLCKITVEPRFSDHRFSDNPWFSDTFAADQIFM